jgi:hypothetical protein
MTQVFVNPELDDYFVEYDFRDTASGTGARVRQSIVDDYADEKVILLRKLQFDADLTFLRNVTFYQKWKWKKLPLSNFEAMPPKKRRRHPEVGEFVQDVFAGDWGRFDYFLEQATRVNDQLREALGTIFVNYRFTQRNIIWRFTETRVENMHFDIDRNCDNLELIRAYVNLDEIPRIWYTSGAFSVTANEWYGKLDLVRFRGESPANLLNELNMKVFGDWNVRGRDKVPRHLILFEPGDVWLSDGRLVSHQVIYGRRVVSTLFVAELNGVPDRTKTFAQKVADLHKAQEELRNNPEAMLTANRARTSGRAPNVQAVDLPSSWEKVAEQIGRDTIVRL